MHMGQNPNVALMDEWQPIDFRAMGPAVWIFLASLTVLIVTQMASNKFFSSGQLLLMAGFGFEAARHQRVLVWWLMLAPWLASPLWATIAERLWQRWPMPASVPSFRKTIVAGLVGVVLLVWSAPVQWLVNGRPAPLESSLSKGTPWQLAEQLTQSDDTKAAYLPELRDALAAYGPNWRFHGRVFASETLGDYLLWALPQEMPVLVYTHVHLFSPEHWQKCMMVKRGAAGWDKVLEEYGVNLMVVEADVHPGLRDAVLRDADWKVVLDESGSPDKLAVRTRLFVAVRKKPL
jgi:hypothetical protein